MNVRTRIAPSPTGLAHIGTIYQVLFDYVYAKKHGGQFLVRIEDTDQKRLVEDAEDVVMQAISWFGLEEDESPRKGGDFGPYRQSERLAIYQEKVQELLDKGHAFRCFCTKERLESMRKEQEANRQAPRYDGLCLGLSIEEVEERMKRGEQGVVRMKIPAGETIVVRDALMGDVSFESDTIDMQVLVKADGFPTYHLAVVIDDHLMMVTHIFRGREWLPSTPKHVLLYRYFGWELPTFVHLPLLLNADRPGKLSKRYGHATVAYYQELGYLPEAILNYLSLIVWKHPEGKEIYPLSDVVRLFEIKDITSQGPKFDLAKLNWLNGQWIRGLDDEELVKRIKGYTACSDEQVRRFLPLVKDRLVKLSDFDDLVRFFLVENVVEVVKIDQPEVVNEKERWGEMMRGKNLSDEDVVKIVGKAKEFVEGQENLDALALETDLREWFAQVGYRNADAFMALRVALTGRTATPPLTDVMRVLGKERVVERLEEAASR